MKQICHLDSSYTIIGLSDIKEFNEKINAFTDKSWTQFTINKNLVLQFNKLPIKSISKVYVAVKINSTKIIKTPISKSSNIEGLNLTGKLLLVSGSIYENIIYTSNAFHEPMQYVKLNINFSNHIIIDDDFNTENDSLCIYPYIQDVFLKALSENAINTSITLFLFAHRIAGPIQKLKNSFIFKTHDSDEEIATIEFDINNKKLIVTSLNKSYNNPNVDTAFKFELKDSNESKIKFSEIIPGNDNANNFRDMLNKQSFEFGDIIVLTYDDSDKVILTDYPDLLDTYTMNDSLSIEKFLITQEGIIPILTSNKIIVKSKNNEVVLTIEFAKESRKLIVSSKGVIPDEALTDYYFILILKDKDGNDIIRSTLNSNEDGASFKSMVHDKSFEYDNNSLTLIYKEKNNIEISNYPTQGNDYIPSLDFNIFKIEPDNLEDIALKNKIKIINYINQEMSSLYLFKSLDNTFAATIVATSTAAISTNSQPNNKYVQYLEYSKDNALMYTEILTQSNAENFKTMLDGESIQKDNFNVLRLSNRLNDRIIITNYNTQSNQLEYTVGEEPEFVDIKNNSLTRHHLNYNKIRLKNKNNSSILFLYFDKLDNSSIYIESYSTGVINTDLNSFSFKITDPTDETNIKVQGAINKGDTGDVITIGSQPYNISKNFNFGDLLNLEYSDGSLVEIFDFPERGAVYNPLKTSQKFMITENGLSINKFITNFVFKTYDSNEEMAKIEFDSINKRLIVTSSGKSYNNPSVITAFKFELKHSHLAPPKIFATIDGNHNANDFKTILDIYEFEFGDVINIIYDDLTKVVLNNYPNEGNTYNMALNSKNAKFIITSIGILPILNPKIVVKAKDTKKVVLTIQFIEESEKIIVNSSGLVADLTSSEAYLTFILKDKDGADIIRTNLISNENGDSFKAKVNDTTFKPDEYTLTLIYKEKDNIDILDYPTRENVYTPNLDFNIFRIKSNNLEDVAFNNVIKIINDSDQEMAKLYFIKPFLNYNVITVATSTKAISTNTLQDNENFVKYLKYFTDTPILYEEILKGENALNFSNNLDGNNIEINTLNIIRLSNRLNNRIIISNYKSQNEYMVGEEAEFLEVHQDSLKSHSLNYNKIKLKNLNGSTILIIYFDKIDDNTLYIEPHSTGVVNNDSDNFVFKITDPTESITKIQGKLVKNQTGDTIKLANQPYNISNEFNFGDILSIECSKENLVEIYDFPTKGQIYTPLNNSEKFKIAFFGLRTTNLPNFFLFKADNSSQEIARIKFNDIRNKLVVSSTGKSYDNPNIAIAFKFELKDSNETTIKSSATINGNGNANNFKNILNDQDFEIGDIINLSYENSSKVILTDYPDISDTYTMSTTLKSQKFVVTADGITPILTPNKITVKSKNNEEVLTIQFAKETTKFIVSSKGIVPNSSLNDSYFILNAISKNGRPLFKPVILNSNDTASAFKNILNNKSFSYTNTRLILIYNDKNKVEISNYPTTNNTYIPNLDSNIFEITNNNLIDVSFNSKIKIFNDNNNEICTLQFVIVSSLFKVIVVTYTKEVGTNLISSNAPYIQMLIYPENNTLKYFEIL